MIESYRASGRFGALTIPVAVGVGVLMIGAAWLYQFLIDLIPLIYLAFIGTIGFGIVGAVAMGIGLKVGRCRNVAVATILGVVVVAGALATLCHQEQLSCREIDMTPHWDDKIALENPHKGWYHHYPDNHLTKRYPIARRK